MGDEVAAAYAEELTDRMERERAERHHKYDRLRYLAIEAKKNWSDAGGGDSWEQRDYRNGVDAIIGGDPEYLLVLLQAWANVIQSVKPQNRRSGSSNDSDSMASE